MPMAEIATELLIRSLRTLGEQPPREHEAEETEAHLRQFQEVWQRVQDDPTELARIDRAIAEAEAEP